MKREYYILILILVSILGACLPYIFGEFKFTNDLSLALLSSGLFALLIEISLYVNDVWKYSFLEGKWVREKFLNRNDKTSDSNYDDYTDNRYKNINPEIILKYNGDGEYSGIVHYELGRVDFVLSIRKNNLLNAFGTYQYIGIVNSQGLPDVGIFDAIIDQNKKRIYISHENKLPSGLARGTEIWKKN